MDSAYMNKSGLGGSVVVSLLGGFVVCWGFLGGG